MADRTKTQSPATQPTDDPGVTSQELLAVREAVGDKNESIWSIYLRRFRKHTLGKVGFVILILLYFIAVFADFLAPFDMTWTDKAKSFHPPTRTYWFYENPDGSRGFRPYTLEQRLVNLSDKSYGVIPPRAIRAVSIEPTIVRNELRSISTAREEAGRAAVIREDVRAHYRLSEDSPVLDRLQDELARLERDPDPDARYRFQVGTTIVAGEEQPLELILAKGNKNFMGLFAEGTPYRFLGLFQARRHLWTSPTGGYFRWGTDSLGRDQLSRLMHGARISLSVGLIGTFISFLIGLLIGGISGYFGGAVDTVLMRIAEVLLSIPSIYLLFALRAALPAGLTSVQVYLFIVMILSFLGWAALSRVIRGLVLSIKTEDYVMSARTMGLSWLRIIRRHILPNTFSFTIVQVTLSIPGFILGESALSLLGLGITEPQASWGLMLSAARNNRVMQQFPWILIPGFLIFLAIMAWNLFGDGIRDSVDPKSKH